MNLVLLSILIPVYNERAVVEQSIGAVLAAGLPEGVERELVIVDDCSTDGTADLLLRLANGEPRIRLFRHDRNQGKGAAVRTAIQKAMGDFCLVQDADLEYDPAEYPILLRPLLDGRADAVFGSRYLAGDQHRVLPYWHTRINQTLTLVCNMFCNLHLTDMETCYKVFRTDILKSIPIRSNRFGFEPEITMKCAKRRLRIYEVPISYHGRTYEEGKKIGWKDGLKAFAVILRFWLINDLYRERYNRGLLANFTGTPQYHAWMTDLIRPVVGDRVLEINAGIGAITGRLMGRRLNYTATECEPLFLHALHNRFLKTPNVFVKELDPSIPGDFDRVEPDFDTVLCLNMLEYLDDPEPPLRAMREKIKEGGTLVVLAPQGPSLAGSVDRFMGIRHRFKLVELHDLLTSCGLRVERVHQMNRIGAPLWWLYSRLLRRKKVSKPMLKLFDKTVWFWRLVERLLPWPGLTMIVICRRDPS